MSSLISINPRTKIRMLSGYASDVAFGLNFNETGHQFSFRYIWNESVAALPHGKSVSFIPHEEEQSINVFVSFNRPETRCPFKIVI